MSIDLQTIASDPAAFRNVLVIDTDRGPRPFREAREPWQDADFRALDASWQRAIGRDVVAQHNRACLI